jgi:DNA-binding transcriptional ArsR family regulator
MMMNKLAYQFVNWAAREVVRADRERSANRDGQAAAKALRSALAPNATRILSRLRQVRAERVSDLAAALGIAQPHVSRALRALFDAKLVRKTKRGREVIFSPASQAY